MVQIECRNMPSLDDPKDFEPIYRSCLTCGKLIPLQADSKQVYCSPECSRENVRCPVCGRYFERGTGVVASDETVCSPECARVEHRYDSLF